MSQHTLTHTLSRNSALRRLASDYGALHRSELPPSYLCPPTSAASPCQMILPSLPFYWLSPKALHMLQAFGSYFWRFLPTTLRVLLRLYFEQSSGILTLRNQLEVCVDILKRDWESRLILWDVLTIQHSIIKWMLLSKLMPSLPRQSPASFNQNPDPTLNASAG